MQLKQNQDLKLYWFIDAATERGRERARVLGTEGRESEREQEEEEEEEEDEEEVEEDDDEKQQLYSLSLLSRLFRKPQILLSWFCRARSQGSTHHSLP
jgi:hypothetical protein